jgi:DoxX-like family
VWKVLGGIAILVPRFPRLKEWAYAGIVFDLTGASVSHAVSGDGAPNVIVPLLLAAVAFASWSLRPQSRKLRIAAANATERTPLALNATAAT